MSNYVMEIDHSGGTLVFDITPKFFPTLQFTWKRDGTEVAVVDSVPVEGWFSENDPDVLIGKWNTLRGAALNGSPTVFRFKKATGALIQQYGRAHIQNLTSVEEGGGFVNHIQFRFDVQEERGVKFPDLVDVGREDENIREVDADGSVRTSFRRTVTATGVFGRLAPALNFVKALKPALERLTRESIREISFDGDVVGTWEFDTTDEDNPELSGIKVWRERTSRSPGQLSHRFYPTSSKDGKKQSSILMRGGNRNSRITVTGHIEAYERASLPPATTLLDFHKNAAIGVTDVVVENPEFGGVYPLEFDPDDPTRVILFACDYSYGLLFGEDSPSVIQKAPDPRHVGNQG